MEGAARGSVLLDIVERLPAVIEVARVGVPDVHGRAIWSMCRAKQTSAAVTASAALNVGFDGGT
jgi:hypothetical protein